MMHTLFVTVGSTLFQPLTDAVLDASFLAALPSFGVDTLIVQLGKAQIPLHVALHVGTDGGEYDYHPGSGSSGSQGSAAGRVHIRVLRYTRDAREMEELVARADGVVSHAGSGTILATLRRVPPVPLLVVPNEALMDNHQVELARALQDGGYLHVCSVTDVADGVARLFDSSSIAKEFPAFEPLRFRRILDEAAGFA